MMKAKSRVLPIVSAGIVVFVTGCGLGILPTPDIELPATVQFVLENAWSFRSADDDRLRTVEPGAVIDDLAGLSGCWAAVLTPAEHDVGAGFYVVYHFNPEDGNVSRWSFFGMDTGGLFPFAPIITAEHGTYAVSGENTLLLTIERVESNLDAEANVSSTLQPVPGPGGPYERPALVTLSGDAMLLFIDIESPAEVDAEVPWLIFRRFDCPAAE
jgi:hypothetical protein